MARARIENCPHCRRSLPDFGGWPAWCPECGWGLDAEERPAVRLPRIGQWWQRRTAAAEAAELARLVADPSLRARRHPRRALIYAAAVAVHLVTLALLATGAWVMTTDIVVVLKIGAGIFLFGLVSITFPMHRLLPAKAANRAAAPATLAVAASVAEAVGVAPPARVQVATSGNRAAPTSRRIVTVDVDRWRALDGSERFALLAHELAHHNGHDPRRTMLVILASETIDGWLGLLRPDPRTARRRARRRPARSVMAPTPVLIVGWAELILPIVIAPLYGTVLALGWILRESGWAPGLRAELYADALAAGVAGAESVRGLIDGELAEVAAGGKAPAALANVPELERERRRRLAIATGSRIDPMHPTFAARLQLLDAAPAPMQPVVGIGTAELDAATRELDALVTPNG